MIDNCADFCSWLTVSYGGAKGHSGAKLGSENLGFSKTARHDLAGGESWRTGIAVGYAITGLFVCH